MLLKNEAAGKELDAFREAFASALVGPLLHTPVLRILSDLQRHLDALDIEGLSKLWTKAELAASSHQISPSSFSAQTPEGSKSAPSSTPLGMSSPLIQVPNPTISDWIDFVDTYTSPNEPKLDHSNPSPENLRYYILAYLLSATFKDCSIIVKLNLLQSSSSFPSEIAPTSVTVIDLDPKRVDKLKVWEKLDQEIVRTYALANKKTCIDAGKPRT
jgi:inositol-pentakisphosphate 2-kinase